MMIEEPNYVASIVDDQHSLNPEGEREQWEKGLPQRHDRGPRITARDMICLLWTAHQFAIRLISFSVFCCATLRKGIV